METAVCTMVDSITPATDSEFSSYVEQKLGVKDNWPIQREAFTQWVVEDHFSSPRPCWENVGVTFTHDVSFFEKAPQAITADGTARHVKQDTNTESPTPMPAALKNAAIEPLALEYDRTWPAPYSNLTNFSRFSQPY